MRREERKTFANMDDVVAYPCVAPCSLRHLPCVAFSLFPLLSSLLVLLLLPACCGPGRPTTIPVTGTVTFGGKAPPAEGAIYFAPLEPAPGYDKRPGRARFGTDGLFAATSFEDGDGLLPGTYRVSIECWKSPPLMGAAGNSHVPPDFTPPELAVPASGRMVYDVNVPAAQ